MPAIDMHNHMAPPDVVRFIEQNGEKYQTRIIDKDGGRWFLIEETATRPINAPMTQPESRLADMDVQGIDVQAISCIPFLMYGNSEPALGLPVAQTINDALAEVGRHGSGRFAPLASVPMSDPQAAAKELDRARTLGMRGVQITPSTRDRGYDEPDFEPFWAAAESLGMVVCIHPFEAAPTGVLARYNLGNLVGNLYQTGLAGALIICGGVLERHPNLHVVLFHAGGALPATIGRIDNGYRSGGAMKNITRPPSSYFNQIWFDSISNNPAMLSYLASTYGADHIVIGTDYPLGGGRPKHPVEEIKALKLDSAGEAAALGGNAAALLHLA